MNEICDRDGGMKMSCQCFAEMMILPFRQISGAPYVPFLAKVMPKFSVTTHGSDQLFWRAGENGHRDEGNLCG